MGTKGGRVVPAAPASFPDGQGRCLYHRPAARAFSFSPVEEVRQLSIKIMSAVWELDLPRDEKIVLLAFADHADDDGVCWPAVERIALKCGYSERSIQRKLGPLQDRGLLVEMDPAFVGGRGQMRRFRVSPEKGDKLTPLTNGKGDKLSVKGDNGVVKKGDIAVSPEPSIEPSRNQADLFGGNGAKKNGDLYTPGFERLWAIHRQGGKKPAARAYHKAIKVIKQGELEELVEHYRDRVLRDGFDGCHLSTWLNGEYWEAEREHMAAGNHNGRKGNPMSVGRLK